MSGVFLLRIFQGCNLDCRSPCDTIGQLEVEGDDDTSDGNDDDDTSDGDDNDDTSNGDVDDDDDNDNNSKNTNTLLHSTIHYNSIHLQECTNTNCISSTDRTK